MSDLTEKYKYLLAGFEGFGFTDEQLQLAVFSLETARQDMESCMSCDGEICKTSVNRRELFDRRTGELIGVDYSKQDGGKFYYTLSPEGCALYKCPSFALFECPGVLRRKEEISGIFRRVKNREEKRKKVRVYGEV